MYVPKYELVSFKKVSRAARWKAVIKATLSAMSSAGMTYLRAKGG